jgi:LPXTG-site transpeptidase (sortase) family protein
MRRIANSSKLLSTLLAIGLAMIPLVSTIPVLGQSLTPPQINGIFNPDSMYPSETSRLTINVFNPNNEGLTEVNWVDHLPDDLVVVDPANPLVSGCGSSYTLTAVPGSDTISLSRATTDGTSDPVNPGICSVTVSVTSFDVGNHTNVINADEGSVMLEGSEVNYQYDANITLLVLPMESPEISKSFDSPINAGETSQMEIAITNSDENVALTQVELQDDLPAGMSLSDPLTYSLSNCGSGTLEPLAIGDTSVTLSGATIGVGNTCRIRVNVETDGTGTYTNTISPDDLSTYQKVTIPSDASADLVVKNVELDKSFSPSNFQAGGTSTLTLTITNPNTTEALTNVNFTDYLPANLTVIADSGLLSGADCLGTVDTSVASQVSLSGGTIPAGGACELTATVTASVAAKYTNTVSCDDMTFDEGTPGCQEANADLTVYPVSLGTTAVKRFSPGNIEPGTNTTMTITITAPGDTDLTDFNLTDNLPENVYISATPNATQNNCGAGTISAVAGASVFGLSGGTIPAGGTCTLTVRVTSSEYGPHTNTIHTSDIHNAEDRNIEEDVEAVFTVRDISVSKNYDNSLVGADGVTRLTITLTNNYSIPITDVAFSDTLGGTTSDGIIIATPSNLTNTCNGTVTANAGEQTITLSGGSIAADEDCTVAVDVQGKSSTTPPPGTTYTNEIDIGDVTGKVNGTTSTHNWDAASDSLTVGSPDFRINKKFAPILVTGNYPSTMTITLVNPQSSPISNITFSDSLPEHMLLSDPPNPSTGTCGGTLTPADDRMSFSFEGGELPAKGSCKLTIEVVMEVTGNLINSIPAYSVTTTQGATNVDPTSATLTNLSSVGITKQFSPNPVTPGSVSQVTITISKIGIGIGLTGLEFTDELTDGLTIAASPVPINHCGGTLDAPVGGTTISFSDGELPIGTDSCDVTVSVLSPSTDVDVDGYVNTIPAGTIVTDEGYTNIMDAEDTLGTIFDPPTGRKTYNPAGLPQLEWKLVWINNTNSSAVDAQISDAIPDGTTYVAGSVSCVANGSSRTDTCDYDAVEDAIFWSGEIGPDRGATDEDDALNEVVITFLVDVPDTLNTVRNQSSAVVDSDGDGDFDDEAGSSTVVSNRSTWNRYSSSLPESGFAPGRTTNLPPQPAGLYQSSARISVEIPALQLDTDLVNVPVMDGKWQVSWLGNRLGYLEGTAFPTHEGNSGITGHVYDANGNPGIFHDLKTLKWGDEIRVHAYGQIYVYEVRSVDKYVEPEDTSAVYQHEDYPWLTLITCRDYDEQTNSYAWRVVVRAVQTKIY